MRYALLLAALSLVATPAAADQLTRCPFGSEGTDACPSIPGETLLSTVSAIAFVDTPENPLTTFQWTPNFGVTIPPATQGPPVLLGPVVSPGHIYTIIVDPHGYANITLIDPVPPDYEGILKWYFHVGGTGGVYFPDPTEENGWRITSGGYENYGVVGGPSITTLPVADVFNSGTYGGWTVESNISLANGFNLAGSGYYLRKIVFITGAATAIPTDVGYDGFRTFAPVMIQFIGAPGQIPEPASMMLLAACVLVGLCCRGTHSFRG